MLSVVPSRADYAEARFLLRTVETWRPHMTHLAWAVAALLLVVSAVIAVAVAVAAAVGFLLGSSIVLLTGRAAVGRTRWLPGGR